MKLFVDGVIYQKQAHGGISRIFNEILPRMCALAPDLKITLFTDGPIVQALPQHPHITIKAAPPFKRQIRRGGAWRTLLAPVRRTGARWWNLARSAWIGSGKGAIWHSTYYTLPDLWQGRTVITVYDLVHEFFPALFPGPLEDQGRLQKQRCIERADAVLCISAATQADVIQHYQIDPARTHVTHLAYNATDFHPLPPEARALPPELTNPFLLYVGGRADYKNFSAVLGAYARWPRRPDVNLVVVGPPWTPAERARLADLHVGEQVHLLTGADDNLLCRLYNQAVAFVYPSLYEGFGIPLLEAMACGCPIVASRIPSSLEVAGDYPEYFDASRPDDLLNALERVTSAGRSPEKFQWGQDQAARFSWDRTAEQTLAVYRALR